VEVPDLQRTIASIQSKVEKLVHLHRKQAEDNAKLLKDKELLLEQIEQQKQKIKSLENKVAIVSIATGQTGNEENKNELRSRVNELVREIDKCIALLNR
jgi:hypothetical protein